MERLSSNQPLEASLQHRIRMRAYDLYTQRGKADGHALDDWLQAEDEIVRGANTAMWHETNKNYK